jgi:hypothetical protein
MVKSKGKKQIRWEYHSLVGGIPIPLKKNMSSSVGMIIYSQLNGNSLKKSSKPPTDIFKATHVSRGNLSFVEHHLLGE